MVMGSKFQMVLALTFTVFLLLPMVNGEKIEDEEDVDIDSYISLKIEFTSGDSLDLEADIEVSKDPISVFLIKGDEEFSRWRESEEIDIQAILAGENVSGTDTFKVIKDFSKNNVTEFTSSLTIGEKDTYYLVIVIYRNIEMSKEDILSRGSRVTYMVKWTENEKDVPYWLLGVAAFIGLIGIGLIWYYFKDKREMQEEDEEPDRRDNRLERRRDTRGPPLHERKNRRPPVRKGPEFR
jgi:hypothetical protein